METSLEQEIAAAVEKGIREAAKRNPGLLMSRDLCDERHANVKALIAVNSGHLKEIRWVLRAVGAVVLLQSFAYLARNPDLLKHLLGALF